MRVSNLLIPVFLIVVFLNNKLCAQKKIIDSNAYRDWTSLGFATISNDGKYVSYIIENDPVNSSTMVIQATQGNWKKSFIGIDANPLISKGGKYAAFRNKSDSLIIVSLGKELIQFIPNVVSFSMAINEGSEWIAYQLGEPGKGFYILNLTTGKRQVYNNVLRSIWGADGQTMVLQTGNKIGDQIIQEISWLDIDAGRSSIVWQSEAILNVILDAIHNQLAFTSKGSIYYYKKGAPKAVLLVDKQNANLDEGLKLGGIRRFNNDGDRLFISLDEENKPIPKTGSLKVWSYLDPKLPRLQELEFGPKSYTAIIDLNAGKIIRLEQKNDWLFFNNADKLQDNLGSIENGLAGIGTEQNFNIKWNTTHFLMSTKDGKRIKMPFTVIGGISPCGKFVVWYDPEQDCYTSYNVGTGIFSNISKGISESLKSADWENTRTVVSIAGWLENDEGLLVYDRHDLWYLDPLGEKAPINLTKGYGRKNNIVFSVLQQQNDSKPFRRNQRLILTSFELRSKINGFYNIKLNKADEPNFLSKGNYIYDTKAYYRENYNYIPTKAKNAEVYIVRRMSASESPNYFVTKDFKTFNRLSDIHPERNYNWVTTELFSWKSLKGDTIQGILYKPEDFDCNKKYPVIFHYYESKSQELNSFKVPEASRGPMNIPTFVSNGYLVFAPDIHYISGDPMRGTYDCVISAAKFVSGFPFVDSMKLGIQGHSFGGYQTDYLITHSDIFAAACSASGFSNLISSYGNAANGVSGQAYFEEGGQGRMGGSIWQMPNRYIKNSPIFNVHKVTTPTLMMHGIEDNGIVDFTDAVQFFTGLRRLGKKAWLLAYQAGHGLDGKDASDFNKRMMQFFDHYLRDKPAPIWMTRGIPFEKCELDNGYEFDPVIKTPGPGLLTEKQQRIADSLLTRKPITIELQ